MRFLVRRLAPAASLLLIFLALSACSNPVTEATDDRIDSASARESLIGSWKDAFADLDGDAGSKGPLSKNGSLYRFVQKYLPDELKKFIDAIPSDLSSLLPALMESELGEELFNEENIVRRDRDGIVYRLTPKLCDLFAPDNDGVSNCRKLFQAHHFQMHFSRTLPGKVELSLYTGRTGHDLSLLLSVSLAKQQVAGKLNLTPVQPLLDSASQILGGAPIDISDLRGQFSWNLGLGDRAQEFCAAGSRFCFAVNLDEDLNVKVKTGDNDVKVHWKNDAPLPHLALSENRDGNLNVIWNGAEMDGNFSDIVVHFAGAQLNLTLLGGTENTPLEVLLENTRIGPGLSSVTIGALQISARITGQNDDAISQIRVSKKNEGIVVASSDAKVQILLENSSSEQCRSTEKLTWKINGTDGASELLIPVDSLLLPTGLSLSTRDAQACDPFSVLVLTPLLAFSAQDTCTSPLFVMKKGKSEVSYDYEISGQPGQSKLINVNEGQCIG